MKLQWKNPSRHLDSCAYTLTQTHIIKNKTNRKHNQLFWRPQKHCQGLGVSGRLFLRSSQQKVTEIWRIQIFIWFSFMCMHILPANKFVKHVSDSRGVQRELGQMPWEWSWRLLPDVLWVLGRIWIWTLCKRSKCWVLSPAPNRYVLKRISREELY